MPVSALRCASAFWRRDSPLRENARAVRPATLPNDSHDRRSRSTRVCGRPASRAHRPWSTQCAARRSLISSPRATANCRGTTTAPVRRDQQRRHGRSPPPAAARPVRRGSPVLGPGGLDSGQNTAPPCGRRSRPAGVLKTVPSTCRKARVFGQMVPAHLAGRRERLVRGAGVLVRTISSICSANRRPPGGDGLLGRGRPRGPGTAASTSAAVAPCPPARFTFQQKPSPGGLLANCTASTSLSQAIRLRVVQLTAGEPPAPRTARAATPRSN